MMMTMMQILPALLRTNIEEKGGSVAGVVLGLMFCGLLFVLSLVKLIQDYTTCTQPVQALCVDHETRRGRKGRTLYAPVWEYEYHGQYVRVRSNSASNVGVPKVGSVHTLYVNPHNPEKFRRKVSDWLPFVIVSALFLGVIIAIIVV